LDYSYITAIQSMRTKTGELLMRKKN